MKRLLVCWFMLLCSWAAAQEASPTPEAVPSPIAGEAVAAEAEAPEHPAHNELRRLRQQMEEAMNALDIDSLLDGVASEVVFSTMNGDVVRGKEQIRSYFHEMMTGPDARVKEVKTKFEVDELTILYGAHGDASDPSFGIAYGHSQDEYTLADGTRFQVTPRWSAAMVKTEEGWKIANFHYSVNMFDNPVVGKMKSTLGWVGGLGLLLGLLIGFFIGRRK